MKYDKKPIDIKEQITRLRERGLIVSNEGLASQYLNNISYYRLRAYTYPFQNNEPLADHVFLRRDITFEDIIDIYNFDKTLRTLLFHAIEEIEIALRTRITLTYSMEENDGFWFLQPQLYHKYHQFLTLTQPDGELMKEVKRSHEEFIKHYFNKYSNPSFPPAWMTLEVVSMGTLSRLYSSLDKNNNACKAICREFGLFKVEILQNWLHALTALRNACAHHSRIWNRRFTINLRFPHRTVYPFLLTSELKQVKNNKLFAYLSVILYMMKVINPNSSFKKELLALLALSPKLVSPKDMGFPNNWEDYTLWK